MHPSEQDRMHGHEEILNIGPDGVLQILREVLILRGIEFLKGLGMIDIEGRDEARFGFRSLVLQPLGIGLKHGLRQRTYAHEFNVALDPVDEHRQFVEPVLAHDLTPGRSDR